MVNFIGDARRGRGMMIFDRNQLMSALIVAATALFLLAGGPRVRWHRQLRIAALALYGAAFIGALAYVGLWLAGIVG